MPAACDEIPKHISSKSTFKRILSKSTLNGRHGENFNGRGSETVGTVKKVESEKAVLSLKSLETMTTIYRRRIAGCLCIGYLHLCIASP